MKIVRRISLLISAIICFVFYNSEVFAVPTLTTVHNFNWGYDGPYGDGAGPGGFSVWGANDVSVYNGRLYGMTMYGGQYSPSGGDGVIYTCLPDGSDYHIIHTFSSTVNDGYRPFGGLTEANGMLYGLTYYASGQGEIRSVLFKISPYQGEPYIDNYEILHQFRYPQDLVNPQHSLLLYNNKLWGTCENGGPGGVGMGYAGGIFAYDLTNNTYEVVHNCSYADGYSPKGKLTLYNGRLYTTTTVGDDGTDFGGSIISINPNVAGYDFIKHCEFPTNTNPQGVFVELDGFLFTNSYNGGASQSGAIWKFNPNTNELSNLMSMPVIEGDPHSPCGGLMVYQNKLWNATFYGGGCGGLISVNSDGTGYQKHQNFGCGGLNSIPSHPTGTIINYNRYIYGVTKTGGQYASGTVYRYGPFTEKSSMQTSAWLDWAPTSVTGVGVILDNGGENCTTRGFVVSYLDETPELGEPNTAQFSENGSFANGEYTLPITNLTPNTQYYYRSYSTNSQGTSYGNVISFTTPTSGTPEVATDITITVNARTATLFGSIINSGLTDCTQRGFVYSNTELIPTIQNSTITSEFGTFTAGNYSTDIEGLMSETHYYYRAFAVNASGASYGEVREFTTLSDPLTVRTYSAYQQMTPGQIRLSGEVMYQGISEVTERGFQLCIDHEFNLANSITVRAGAGLGYYTADTVIETNQQYFYRAYAINSAETAYGAIDSIYINQPQLNVYVMLQGYWNGTRHKPVSVSVELRTGETLSSSALAYRIPAIIGENGRIMIKTNDYSNPYLAGDYWIVVRAAGYLPIASNARLTLDPTIVTNWNFTDNQTFTYSNNMTKLSSGKYVMKAGDFNGDKNVSGTDIGIMKSNSGSNGGTIPAE